MVVLVMVVGLMVTVCMVMILLVMVTAEQVSTVVVLDSPHHRATKYPPFWPQETGLEI